MGKDETPRLLACGKCFEEDGEEIHPHPECTVDGPLLSDGELLALYPESLAALEALRDKVRAQRKQEGKDV